MSALFVAAFAYDYSLTHVMPMGGRPRRHQVVLTAWSDDELRTKIDAYLRDRIPAAIVGELVGAFEGARVLQDLDEGHVYSAVSVYVAAAEAQGNVDVAVALTILPMTRHRATQAICLASAFGHGPPTVFLGLSDEDLDTQLARVSQTVRHLERLVVPALPPADEASTR